MRLKTPTLTNWLQSLQIFVLGFEAGHKQNWSY
jgi:hypothetical protein